MGAGSDEETKEREERLREGIGEESELISEARLERLREGLAEGRGVGTREGIGAIDREAQRSFEGGDKQEGEKEEERDEVG